MSRTIKRTPLRWLFCLYFGTLTVLILNPVLVRAHAEYERSDPPDGAVVPAPPEAVHIWFTQELFRREGKNSIEVIGPDGAEAHQGEAVIDDDDRAHMWVMLRTGLGEGEYLVRWRNLSAEDGDTEQGEFTFVVDPSAPEATLPPASPATAPPPASEAAPTDAPGLTAEAQPSSGITCFGTPLVAIGMIALGWRRRKRDSL